MLKVYCDLLVCINVLLLTGCGTKGPLYIPEQRYPQQAFKQTHKSSLAQGNQLVVIQKPIVIYSN